MHAFGRSTLQWVILVGLAAVVIAGCARQQQAAQAPPPAGEGVTEVQVTLTDFAIEASQTTFTPGTRYRFVVTNKGGVAHEFMITPPMMGGMMSEEQMHEMALLEIEEDELPPGTTKTIEFTFSEAAPEGKLEFACHVEGHYEAGMHRGIIVQ